GNDETYFYEVMIEDLQSDALTLYEYDFVTSTYVNFFHHLHTFDHRVWKKPLPDSGDVRKQSFAEVWPSPLLRPQHVSINVVMTGDTSIGFLLQSPEPMEWERIKWQVEQNDEIYSIGGFEKVK